MWLPIEPLIRASSAVRSAWRTMAPMATRVTWLPGRSTAALPSRTRENSSGSPPIGQRARSVGLADPAHRCADLDILTFGDGDLEQDALAGRLDIGGDLLGLDRIEHVARLEAFADLAVPLHQRCLVHVHAQLGQFERNLHRPDSFISDRTAAAMRAWSGSIACSSAGE